MRKVTVEFEDFDGNTKTKDLYFHLTDAEVTLLNIKNNGKFENVDNETLKSMPAVDQLELFENIIKTAYGQKLEDGTFVKDETARKAFLCSPEYSAFLMKILSGEIDAQDFILSCFSKSISNKISIDSNGNASIKE